MRLGIAMLSVAILFSAGKAAGAEVLRSESLYSATFNEYEEGEKLDSSKGTEGGTWGQPAVPSGMDAFAVMKPNSTNKYMSCSTISDGPGVTGIGFIPENEDTRSRQSVEMSIMAGVNEELPEFPDGAKTGFSVYAPEGGTTSLVGWVGSQKCWTNLHLQSGVKLPAAQWYELLTKFWKRGDGRVFVQYWLKVGSSYYVLKSQDGDAWLDLGKMDGDSLLRKVEFRGDGGLEYLEGAKPTQGLYVGIGRWYDVTSYDAGYDKDYGKGEWLNGNRPKVDDEFHAFAIDVAKGGEPNIYKPNMRRTASESIEVSLRFISTSRDESISVADTCALVRLVAEPNTAYTQPDPTYRFACLVDSKWMTNTTMVASFEKDYVFQILLDSNKNTVTYRVKEGIGYDSGAYTTLFDGAIPAEAFGRYSEVYFEGAGLVYKIKGTDRTGND